MKKLVSLILALMMVLSVAALAEEMPAYYDNYPICEPGAITLNYTAMQTPVTNTFDKLWIWTYVEEKTGIHIEWTNVPSDMRAEKLNLMLASYDLPDVLYKMSVSTTQQAQYGAEGTFVDLMQYKGIMPNVWYWWDKYPTALDAMVQDDGNIYGANYILSGYAINMGSRVYFNTDVMEKVNWDHAPTTLDEFEQFLLDCKALDYNGNGIADEIPLSLQGSSDQGDPMDAILFGSFGLRNHGSAISYVDEDLENGGLRFIRTSDGYKEYLRYTAKLYQEGLIDPDLFTNDFAALIAKCQEGRALNYIFVNNSPVAGSEYEQYTLGMKQPFAGEYDLWTNYTLPASSASAFTITMVNEYPEESAKWVDYLYSEEGLLALFLGKQAETKEDPDHTGTWYYDAENDYYDYTDWVLNDPNGINFEQVLGSEWVCWMGGSNPSAATNEQFKGGETWPCSVESAEGLLPYTPEDIWVGFTFDSDTSAELSRLQADFQNYYRQYRAEVWTGQKDVDTTWDEYVAGFNALGVEEYMNYYTAKAIDLGKIAG